MYFIDKKEKYINNTLYISILCGKLSLKENIKLVS